MPDWKEPDIKRQAYLHEAGHTIVARNLELVVNNVMCNGEIGYCDATLSSKANARLNQLIQSTSGGSIKSVDALDQVVDAYFPKLITLLGGIAGESLVFGKPIYTTRRASDDLTSFFGFLAAMSKHLPAKDSHPVWQNAFERAQDNAWQIIKERWPDVEKLADALQTRGTLSGDEVTDLFG